MTLFNKIISGLFALLLISGCTQTEQQKNDDTENATNFEKAVAVVHPTQDSDVSGTVTFTKGTDGVNVQAEISGLGEGNHGFHIHQYGDCSATDGTSAGGHYSPAGNEHGAPTDAVRHMGDMGNLAADSDGNATLDYVDPNIKLNGPNSIIGRGIIIHGGADDFTSQPSGAAGPRKACGVIGIADAGQ